MVGVLEMDNAVFLTAGQAVHVAYTILAKDAPQDAPLRAALIRVMESIRLDTGGQRDWLAQLRGERSESVNFGGLDGNDVRAQCVMIQQAVRTRLPAPEMWALQAKFGQTDFEDVGEDGQLPPLERPRKPVRRFAFSGERIAAIQGLADWAAPSFPQISHFALDLMIGKVYASHARIEISFRSLAANFGGNHMKYARAYKSLRNRLRALELVALDRLEPYFIAQGVIEDYRDSH